MLKEQFNMGLKSEDLRDLVYDIFEIDSYASKMGADKDIVTLSFSVKTKESADDLMNFIEKGYNFVLDADATSGEQSDGTYKVFVELERNKESHDNILEIVDGVSKLSGKDKFKFRYYKNFRSNETNQETLEQFVPTDPNDYGIKVTESNLDNYKNFFNKSFLDSVDLLENKLVLRKKYADTLRFEFVDFLSKEDLPKVLKESFDINSYPEILFLTKYIGDYNISKYGEKLVFENKDKALVLKRI